MSDFVPSLIGGTVGAASVLAAAWALVRYVLVKRIDQYFATFQSRRDTLLDLHRIAAEDYVQRQLAIYPALSELVYQAKLGADTAAAAQSRFAMHSSTFVDACRDLTTQLLAYRLYLEPDLFAMLHEYKHCMQDLLIIIDVLTRAEDPDVTSDIPDDVKHNVDVLVKRIGHLSNTIISQLHEGMKTLRGPLAANDG